MNCFKKIISVFICCLSLILICCATTNKNTSIEDESFPLEDFSPLEGEVCYLTYKDSINGFKVRVKLNNYEQEEFELFGSAEIGFYKNNALKMSFVNPLFKINLTGLKEIKNYDIVTIDYKTPKVNFDDNISLGVFKELPFFFLDVDFDGNDELLLSNPGAGQRYCTSFLVYSPYLLFNDIIYDTLYDKLKNIPPYQELDELSELDYRNKEISIFNYGGYSDSEKRIYKRNDNTIQLDRIEDYDSLGYVLARRRVLKIDTITTYHNGREYLYKK